MTRIIRWNPYREMYNLMNSVDRRVDSRYLPPRMLLSNDWSLALDVAENDEEYTIQASLPGINPEDLDISIESNVLTIKGEYKQEEEQEGLRYHMRERRYGSFCRSLSLPNTVNTEAVDAKYEAGVLTLSLPKAEEAKPQRIEVKTADQPLIKDAN
jgi:HSP20 family protein